MKILIKEAIKYIQDQGMYKILIIRVTYIDSIFQYTRKEIHFSPIKKKSKKKNVNALEQEFPHSKLYILAKPDDHWTLAKYKKEILINVLRFDENHLESPYSGIFLLLKYKTKIKFPFLRFILIHAPKEWIGKDKSIMNRKTTDFWSLHPIKPPNTEKILLSLSNHIEQIAIQAELKAFFLKSFLQGPKSVWNRSTPCLAYDHWIL